MAFVEGAQRGIKLRSKAGLVVFIALVAQMGAAFAQADAANSATGSPLRLRQDPAPETNSRESTSREPTSREPRTLPEANVNERPLRSTDPMTTTPSQPQRTPLPPRSEFESFVQRNLGDTLATRIGVDWLTGLTTSDDSNDYSPLVPPDYIVRAGDELVVTFWGSVDADLRLQVDRSGRISIPRIGPVMVSGLRYGDLTETLRRRADLVFRNYEVSVSLGKLRGIRVFVTGFVKRPGAVVVNSLSTITLALSRAGGPSAAGSFRNVQLRRGRERAENFDLYDLLLRGDRSADRILQPDDVIHVGAVGEQVAIIGSVNRPSILELKAGEKLSDAMLMVGNLSAVADRSRVVIERLTDRNDRRIEEVALPAGGSQILNNGDVVRVFSVVDATLSQYRQYKLVRIDGEVQRPGEFILPPASTLQDALAAAGGITPQAFIYGAEFTRESVRVKQQENYERALRDLQTEYTRAAVSSKISSGEDAAIASSRQSGSDRLIERLRAVKPSGRVILQVDPAAEALPSLVLEDGDRLTIPTRPNTVGVFGSVFNAGSYLFTEGREVSQMLALAGGPTRGADAGSVFVVRANGSVISARQSGSSWFGLGNRLTSLTALPGDTIFVPEELNRTTWIQDAKEWTQILYQLGFGAAALKTLRQ